MKTSEKVFSNHVRTLRRKGTWGDMNDVRAAQNLYNVNIDVWIFFTGKEIPVLWQEDHDPNRTERWYFLYRGNRHYELFKKKIKMMKNKRKKR